MDKTELEILADDIIDDIFELIDDKIKNLTDSEKYFVRNEIKEYFGS